MGTVRRYLSAFSLTSDSGITAGGHNDSYLGTTERYTDGETYFTGFAARILR
jgi:hypothetical protein